MKKPTTKQKSTKKELPQDMPHELRVLVDSFKDSFDKKTLEMGISLAYAGQCMVRAAQDLMTRGRDMMLEASSEFEE